MTCISSPSRQGRRRRKMDVTSETWRQDFIYLGKPYEKSNIEKTVFPSRSTSIRLSVLHIGVVIALSMSSRRIGIVRVVLYIVYWVSLVLIGNHVILKLIESHQACVDTGTYSSVSECSSIFQKHRKILYFL